MPAVTRLVTSADVDRDAATPEQVSVSARHEAELGDGSRVLLLDDRGWGSTQSWAATSVEDIQDTTRVVVGPDEPSGNARREDMEASHWVFLQQKLHRQGVVVDVAVLMQLPHDVVLSRRLLARIDADPDTGISF